MIARNLLAWSLQIAMLVALAALAVQVLRLRLPGARLLYWQAALLACLALPVVRPWKHAVASAIDSVSVVTIVRTIRGPAHRGIPLPEAALGLLAAGILLRGIWLAAGFWGLRQYRRQSRWLASRVHRCAYPNPFPARSPLERSARWSCCPLIFRSSRRRCKRPSCAMNCSTCAAATGSLRSAKKSCARSSGSTPPSRGRLRRSAWHASRKWIARWFEPPNRASDMWMPCSPSPAENRIPTSRRHPHSCAGGN